MMGTEMVTDFAAVITEPIPEKPGYLRTIGTAKIRDLLKALNKFCGKLADEYDFGISMSHTQDACIPADFRWLIAYMVEGGSEGYYVHVGAIVPQHTGPSHYVEFGLAKTFNLENAQNLAREAQRFLSATQWN